MTATHLEFVQVVYTRGALLWQQLTSGGSLNQSGRLSYKSKRKVTTCAAVGITYLVIVLLTQWGSSSTVICSVPSRHSETIEMAALHSRAASQMSRILAPCCATELSFAVAKLLPVTAPSSSCWFAKHCAGCKLVSLVQMS